MIDESLKTGPLPEVVEVGRYFVCKGRPIAYDAKLGYVIYERLKDGKGTGVIDFTRFARPVPPRIPTDEDAKRRPKVRWRTPHNEWSQGELRAVIGERFWLVTNGQMECCCHCELIE